MIQPCGIQIEWFFLSLGEAVIFFQVLRYLNCFLFISLKLIKSLSLAG